ncbi:Histone-lysine N-methyltransferase SETMAR [Dufourea novaeangliae]|uniref:Histone-lysine N-methyltransferase SETMAR n=2 Tax=Dufourea novaeangliae TaxID=178035 RepID=A0A154PMV8_DUFNO|nr:Histone-lysine N-methyltransferase SETMAR [Dufourea novaeangliae]
MLSKGVSILHDNASPHVACTTVALLQQFGWDIITHPPYSPDLAPSDYHLFPKLKEHSAGTRFSNDVEVKDEVQRFVTNNSLRRPRATPARHREATAVAAARWLRTPRGSRR